MKITHGLILGFSLCFYSFFGVAMSAQANAGEYYIYQDSNGRLVISNKEPPSGSKIIRQRTLTDEPKIAVQDAPGRNDTQPNERPDDSLKQSETK